ncbi:MAG: NADH-quinone oxidoreductase subunit NuoF [Deltaproteobacteria bacterium]|nr:NADH-quinone oxidoreductase subunit NuoF [Deltaproteobacteria bacterium]
MNRLSSPSELAEFRLLVRGKRDPSAVEVAVCGDTGCRAWGADEVIDRFEDEIRKQGLEGKARVKRVGCPGFCERGPVVTIRPHGIFYQRVMPEDVPEVVSETIEKYNILGRLLWQDPESSKRFIYESEVPFYAKQTRNILGLNGLVDPTSIEDAIAFGAYAGLEEILGWDPNRIIETVDRAGLRGRGGGGFPTGTKWRFCRSADGDRKFIICNADEGDPGAFMDRAILEGNPHSVIEGMIIGARAMGASEGYIYCRAEYPLAIERLSIALEQAGKLGLLGKNILGAGFDFTVRLYQGAGAFVCGEETALIASIEGRRGMPRPRPPFPVQSGLFGRPTVINNVETWANVPRIISMGPDVYASLGTEKSKGTKIFSLTGKVNNTGLVEVPMGVTIREVVFDVGGGIPRNRRFKAVQMGGPSGGCIPEKFLNLHVDYDSLQSVGSIMGSGGMVVMDENTCMVEVARYFVSFTAEESCGQCSPCRIGTRQMLGLLTRITEGQGTLSDLDRLERIAQQVKKTSLCGLGQTCPNPVLSTLRHFREEYEAHVVDKRCPAGVCESLVLSPCQHACPAGIDVPAYVAFIAQGDYAKAVDVIRERNPFPAICGRICHHPCEGKCRRGEVDDPISIRYLKRFAADWAYEMEKTQGEPFPITKKERVAIVGAGPAGLTCAYFLAKMGYKTTVFEALPRGGGMLAVGVPEFRLPLGVLEREIGHIESKGVEILYDSPIDEHHTVENLKAEGFAAVFIAAGAHKSQQLGIPGEDSALDGLMYGLHFLRDVKTGQPVTLRGRVLIIGGGNTAIDAARSALRKGARHVTVLYRRSRDEMPVSPIEFHEAEEEGVEFHFLVSPTRIEADNGKVKGVSFIRMQLGEPDQSGRRQPVPIDGSEFFLEADMVIPSVGQAPDLSFLPPDSGLERAKWGALRVDPRTLCTNVPWIFAGGDFVTGASMVIYAIATGRRAALSIDRYVRGVKAPLIIMDEKYPVLPLPPEKPEDLDQSKPRIDMPRKRAEERIGGFEEFETGFSEEMACLEAGRCLRCDLERMREQQEKD